MNSLFKISSLAFVILTASCASGQTQATKTALSAVEFSAVITENQSAQVVDVRTPEEFSQGHISDAQNFNWNGNSFESQIATLDKTKPVYVYCQSGARSAAAARKMRESGFQEVYELEGGISKWRAAGLPVTAPGH